jgi:putative copper export protein
MIYLPRMEAAAAKDDAAFRRARQVFERTITIEAFVLAAVLMLASVLGHTPPPAG